MAYEVALLPHMLHRACAGPDGAAAVQEEIDGYLRPMRAQDWDKGSLLSMRTMNFAGSFPYESITVPVNIIIGEEDTFLLKTAKRVYSFPAKLVRLCKCTPSRLLHSMKRKL